MPTVAPVRPSPIAGAWYESNPSALGLAVDEYMNRAHLPELSGELIGVIAPHAGHIYSGPVAGYAFAAVRSENNRRAKQGRPIRLVAVVSPMHYPYYEPLLTSAHQSYWTPLGEVPIAHDKLALLQVAVKKRFSAGLQPVAYDREHSLEIELPFLQRALPDGFELLPLMIHSQSPKAAEALGLALGEVLADQNALLVASTDLSHFYDQKTARLLDQTMLECFEAFDPYSIFRLEASGRGQACGHAAVAAVLWAAHTLGANTVRTLAYATSGDVTGDYHSVVGYGAAAILKL
ncbi:MAG: AmmeMemoRadiSam system protein B [Anaerolineales bacterium]|nr:AmmeMemoRadiSam system protein B [Anaerolineales bacterium]MCX7609365.1 AmmeMemoRadiSam system protein B [Anaerolineales bacterium]MDW8227662.1 AmmeMemoRadiSam system protein B [Anaerolineales bacterium]